MDGTVVAKEPARTLALGKAWQPTFSAKEFDEEEAVGYLQSLGNFGEYSGNLLGPDYFSFFSALGHRPPTTPGTDLISFAGWLAAGDVGIMCMQKVDGILRSGGLPPIGNDLDTCVISFLVKGEKEHNSVSVLRDL